jgi:hypothetical protein
MTGQATVQLGYQKTGGGIGQLIEGLADLDYAEIVEEINQPSRTSLLLKTYSADYVDRILKTLLLQKSPTVLVRTGLVQPGRPAWLPWQTHRLISHTAQPRGIGDAQSGYMLKIETADPLQGMVVKKVTARKGTIGKIVESIAAENGLESIVEDTKGAASYIQNFETDLDFIVRRMIPRAVNAKGRGNYRMFMRDNVLHFHTPDYQAALRDFNYFNSSGSGFSLTLQDNSQVSPSIDSFLTSYNPYTGVTTQLKADSGNVLRLGNTLPENNSLVVDHATYHHSTNSTFEAVNIVQYNYDENRSSLYSVVMMTQKALFLRIGDILNLTLSPAQTKTSIWSGYYFVVGIKHLVQSGKLTSRFILQRGELKTSTNTFRSLLDLGVDLIEQETSAPGQDLNFAELQNSPTTKLPGEGVILPVLTP